MYSVHGYDHNLQLMAQQGTICSYSWLRHTYTCVLVPYMWCVSLLLSLLVLAGVKNLYHTNMEKYVF